MSRKIDKTTVHNGWTGDNILLTPSAITSSLLCVSSPKSCTHGVPCIVSDRRSGQSVNKKTKKKKGYPQIGIRIRSHKEVSLEAA